MARSGQGSDSPPQSLEEALERAGKHGRAAAHELLAAARALLDALAFATQGQPADSGRVLGLLGRAIDDLSGFVSDPSLGNASILQAVAEALDAEVARWQERATHDADARAVLRAYLGLREILWELGVRAPTSRPKSSEKRREARASAPSARRRPRVQRVPVEG